ncbi:hypothetical protein GCM10009727_89490 [Actinomadura napierensis]|uniref:Uncharacterized protein n=1 Tax=Actinomadura napierensis TaxID=267854 RepID=A0ABN3AI40_9ACTN
MRAAGGGAAERYGIVIRGTPGDIAALWETAREPDVRVLVARAVCRVDLHDRGRAVPQHRGRHSSSDRTSWQGASSQGCQNVRRRGSASSGSRTEGVCAQLGAADQGRPRPCP